MRTRTSDSVSKVVEVPSSKRSYKVSKATENWIVEFMAADKGNLDRRKVLIPFRMFKSLIHKGLNDSIGYGRMTVADAVARAADRELGKIILKGDSNGKA